MPGIVGLITKMPRGWATSQLTKMVEALRHESFYVTGTWSDECAGVYVGWTGRNGSFSDGMPLCNEQGNMVLVFSGEEFAEPGTATRLRQKGHVFEQAGSSYLVHLCEENSDFPASLNGRFHGLLANLADGTATLFNDRYGMHRIYYHESKEAFYFAAEAKAILAVRPELREVDPRGLGESVALGCVLENRTLFKSIYILPPASAWVFCNGSIERQDTYFRPQEWEDQNTLGPEAYYQNLREVFSRNLSRYFNGGERVALSLTGGLDTRMIMAWHKAPLGSLPCYSFGGMFRDSHDVSLGRQVAKACGQPHEVIWVSGEFLSRFPRYAQRTVYLTDGCVDVGHSPDLYVNEMAREIAPVRMTGNYGGEVLRRVRAFKPMAHAPEVFASDFLPRIDDACDTYAKTLQTHPLSFAVFRQAPWHHHGLLSLEETQLSLRSPYLDNDFVRTVFRAPESAFTNSDVALRLIEDGDKSLGRIRTDLGLNGANGHLRAAVHRSMLKFSFRAEYAYDHGMPQWLARIDHFLSPLRPERLFLGRHKFYHFRIWYRDALSGYVQDILLDPLTLSRPYLNQKGLERMVKSHLKGTRNYTTTIHKVLTLELVNRCLLS